MTKQCGRMQADRQTERQTETVRHTDSQTETVRHTDTQTLSDRQTNTDKYFMHNTKYIFKCIKILTDA